MVGRYLPMCNDHGITRYLSKCLGKFKAINGSTGKISTSNISRGIREKIGKFFKIIFGGQRRDQSAVEPVYWVLLMGKYQETVDPVHWHQLNGESILSIKTYSRAILKRQMILSILTHIQVLVSRDG